MFMLKSTHEKAMADIFSLTKEAIDEVKKRAESDRTINQRALDAERSITASLRAEIEAMKPDYELGKKRRAAYEADNAKRKAARAVK